MLTAVKRNEACGVLLLFSSSPFQGQKTVPHVKLDDDNAVDQIMSEIALLQHQVRDLNQSYKRHPSTTVHTRKVRPDSDDDSDQSSQDGAIENCDNHARQLEELNRKLLHIRAGLVAIESERCQLLSSGKQSDQQIETLEDDLSSTNIQIHLLQEENLKLRQQLLRRDEPGPDNVRQWKQKYDALTGNFVKVCEKLAKTTNRVSNMEFEKKALVSLNQVLQSKVLQVENRNRHETENMKEVNDRKLQLARRQHEADAQALLRSHEQQINALQRQLTQKTAEFEAMRKEFDSQMQRLMIATAEIDRFSDERAKIETMVARLESLNRACEDYKEILFTKDTKIAVLRADNMKKDLEMKYVTTPSSSNAHIRLVRQTAADASPEHIATNIVTPQHSSSDEEKLRHADDTSATFATVTCMDESFEWACDMLTIRGSNCCT
jgi:DNA repair exonuclease SbcCD ATPase subunit